MARTFQVWHLEHKTAPNLSPKKTIRASNWRTPQGHRFFALLLCHAGHRSAVQWCSVAVSMAGDLTASALRDRWEFKDYGKIIPGHGGILDRFDSVLCRVTFVYYFRYSLRADRKMGIKRIPCSRYKLRPDIVRENPDKFKVVALTCKTG